MSELSTLYSDSGDSSSLAILLFFGKVHLLLIQIFLLIT